MRINDVERYEILAHAFYRMTGFMAPGKATPCDDFGPSMDRREEAWRHWIHTHDRVINKVLEAVCYIIPEQDDEPGEPRDWDHPTLESFVEGNYWHNPEDAIGDIRLYITKRKSRGNTHD